MSLRVLSNPSLMETRDCFDPWRSLEIKADGRVSPCSAQNSVGQLREKTSLSEIVNGEAMQKLRQGLLLGELDTRCKHCQLRPSLSVAEFRNKFVAEILLEGRRPGKESRSLVKYENSPRWRQGIRERILLSPNLTRGKLARVIFSPLHLQGEGVLDLFLYNRHPERGDVRFHLRLTQEERSLAEESLLLRSKSLGWKVEIPNPHGICSLSVSAEYPDGRRALLGMKTSLSYPLFY